jgi:hypothetical protein
MINSTYIYNTLIYKINSAVKENIGIICIIYVVNLSGTILIFFEIPAPLLYSEKEIKHTT